MGKNTDSQAKVTGKGWPGSALLLPCYVAVFLSVRSSVEDLQEGNGQLQDKRIATHLETSVWREFYQDSAHFVSVLSKLSTLESKPFLAIALAAIALAGRSERRKPLTKAFSSIPQGKDFLSTSFLLSFEKPGKTMSGKIYDTGVRKQINYLCLEQLILV